MSSRHNNDVIGPIRPGHVRILQHMLNHRLGLVARYPHRPITDYHKSEIAALSAAIAELNEVIAERNEKP